MIASDKGARGEREDKCSDLIEKMVEQIAGEVIQQAILPDEEVILKEKLLEWADEWKLDLILTSGGTGLGPRDVTPEATRAVIEREAPGIGEAMRLAGLKNTPRAMLSRPLPAPGVEPDHQSSAAPEGGIPRGDLRGLPHAVETVKGKVGIVLPRMILPSSPAGGTLFSTGFLFAVSTGSRFQTSLHQLTKTIDLLQPAAPAARPSSWTMSPGHLARSRLRSFAGAQGYIALLGNPKDERIDQQIGYLGEGLS